MKKRIIILLLCTFSISSMENDLEKNPHNPLAPNGYSQTPPLPQQQDNPTRTQRLKTCSDGFPQLSRRCSRFCYARCGSSNSSRGCLIGAISGSSIMGIGFLLLFLAPLTAVDGIVDTGNPIVVTGECMILLGFITFCSGLLCPRPVL